MRTDGSESKKTCFQNGKGRSVLLLTRRSVQNGRRDFLLPFCVSRGAAAGVGMSGGGKVVRRWTCRKASYARRVHKKSIGIFRGRVIGNAFFTGVGRFARQLWAYQKGRIGRSFFERLAAGIIQQKTLAHQRISALESKCFFVLAGGWDFVFTLEGMFFCFSEGGGQGAEQAGRLRVWRCVGVGWTEQGGRGWRGERYGQEWVLAR